MDQRVGFTREPRQPLKRKELGSNALAFGISVLATIVGLIVLAWAVLYVTKGRFLKPYFESYLTDQLKREVRVGGDFQLYFAPIDIKFRAERMTIANPAWAKKKNFFQSDLIDTNIATIPLIFGDRRINWLDLLDGDFHLEWDRTGTRNTWTMGDPNKPAEPLDVPLIKKASVVGSDIHYRAPQLGFTVDVKVETVRARNTAFESDIRFSGRGSIREKPFTLSGSLMTPNETVRGGRNRLSLTARAGDHSMDVSGMLRGATDFEGANLKTGLRGPNLASLFDLLGIAVPETRRYRLNSTVTKTGDRWRFTGMRGVFGDSDVGGAMTISMPNRRLRIDADLRSRVVDIIDVGPMVGYNAERLDKMGASGAIANEGGRPRVLPDAPLRVDAIRNFDAHVKYRVRTVRMERFPVSNIGLTLDLNRSLMKLSPLTADVAGGHLASNIVINARGRPVRTDYDIRLAPTPMGRLLSKFGAVETGTTGTLKARIRLRGEGDSVRKSLATADGRMAFIMPAGTFWTRNVQGAELDIGTFVQKMFEKKLKEPVRINCGLIAFTVRDGVAAADPILIDTKKNVIAGRGGFSFKNESLNMAVEADAKTFSLFS
ncbi:MAG: AsmA family protein, partial [Pseudomonadota bacterium]|nr:AsmA family protein [Pseudomonadota bacterium]